MRSSRSYLLCALVMLGALYSGTSAHAGTIGPEGWTVLTASIDTRKIHVSSSTGDDGNDGLSESRPKKTIAAGVTLLRDGFPDWLLLKAGDTFYDSVWGWNVRGRSGTELMVLGSYGIGPRPLLKTGVNSGFAPFGGVTHLAIVDLHFIADGYNGSNGTPTAISIVGGPSDILIENCKVEGYGGGIVVQWFGSAPRPENVRIRRSVVVDCYRVGLEIHAGGLYLDGIDGLLLEENVIDHNGWREDIPNAVATMFRRNVYIQSNCLNVVTRGNIIARSASDGMQQRAGGLCENNLFLKNTINLTFATSGTVRNNVLLDTRDLDATSPMGGAMCIDYANGVMVDGNIMAHRTTPATWNVGGIGITHQSQNVTLRRNIIYDCWGPGATQAMAIDVQADTTAVVEDNDFQMPNGVFVARYTGNATFARNRYHSPNPTPFWTMAGFLTPAQWQAATGDNSAMEQVSYPDPGRSAATYAGLHGAVATLEGFLAEARKQSRDYWRPEYTADAVNAYVRAGFGVGTLPVNHPPVILSGPVATPNPGWAGSPVAFSVSASDPDNDPLVYTWNFGDGASGDNAETKHTYAAAGVYDVILQISDGRGGIVNATFRVEIIAPQDATGDEGADTPADKGGAEETTGTVEDSPVRRLHVKRLRRVVKANVNGKDACSVSGELDGLPAGFNANGGQVTVDVAGAKAVFTLNTKGKSRMNNGQFALNRTRRGVTFSAVLRKGDWRTVWAASESDGATVTVMLGGTIYKSEDFTKFRASTLKKHGLASSVEGGICY